MKQILSLKGGPFCFFQTFPLFSKLEVETLQINKLSII